MKMERFTLKPLLMDTDLNKEPKGSLFFIKENKNAQKISWIFVHFDEAYFGKRALQIRHEVVIYNHQRKGENKMFDDFDLMETCEEYYEEEYTEEEEWAKAHFFFMRTAGGPVYQSLI